jgi:hypothetical protein
MNNFLKLLSVPAAVLVLSACANDGSDTTGYPTNGPFDLSLVDTSQDCAGGTPIAGGNIDSNDTWNAAGSPYIISGDLTVQNGRTLTIEPGTEVCVSGAFTLTIDGTLNIAGSISNPVIFRAVLATDALDSWNGLNVNSGATADIDYAYFKNGFQAVYSNSDTVSISNSIFQRNDAGIFSAAANVIDSCAFLNNRDGIDVIASGIPTINNSIFYENVVGLYAFPAAGNVSINNSTFDNNTQDGISLNNPDSTDTMVNLIVTNNAGNGVFKILGGGGAATISYSNLWNNVTDAGGAASFTPGVLGNISEDPLYVNAPADYTLDESSPSVNSGINTGLTDDIAGNPRPIGIMDMGAYEQ